MFEHDDDNLDTAQDNLDAMKSSGEDVASSVDRTSSALLLSDAKRYRKRAQAVERELEELKTSLAEREKTLQEQGQTIALLQQKQHIADHVHQAGALDAQAVTALIETAIEQQPQLELAEIVSQLQREKPYLFRQSINRSNRGVMSARDADVDSSRTVAREQAATNVLQTGKRSDLLRYLRLRRAN